MKEDHWQVLSMAFLIKLNDFGYGRTLWCLGALEIEYQGDYRVFWYVETKGGRCKRRMDEEGISIDQFGFYKM